MNFLTQHNLQGRDQAGNMKLTVYLAVVLLSISYQKAHGLPLLGLDEEHKVKDVRRQTIQNPRANTAPVDLGQFIHGYVNEIYMKLTGPTQLPLDYQMTKANTIRSYENRVEGKLAINKNKHTTECVYDIML